jgi:hypothetical protein
MKKFYIFFSLPAIIIPILVTGLSNYLQDYPYVVPLAMIFVGITSGVNSFFNFSKKVEQHNLYSDLYSELYSEIHSEMTKPKKNRIASDVFVEKTKNRINFLKQSGPDL